MVKQTIKNKLQLKKQSIIKLKFRYGKIANHFE